MTTLDLRTSIDRSPLRLVSLLIPLALVCFALSPIARAQLSPAPDGGYPNNNTAEGDNALFSLTTGFENTAIGFDALYGNTQGRLNTANGSTALQNNTTGANNTATGARTLSLNTTGNDNTATGIQALYSNTTGTFNTATGSEALVSNATGSNNTAHGFQALVHNSTGSNNTANGANALFSNNADNNTANGFQALFSNTTGIQNTANGLDALAFNTTGIQNTANGAGALQNNTTANYNTATGIDALFSNTTGSSNIALGFNAGTNLTTGSNNIDIGNLGVAAEANTIRIGTVPTQTNAYIAGIYQATVAKGVSVVVDSTGHLGTKGSSERFKDAIKPMDKASEAVLALKPVTFHYKKEIDPDGIPQFGLVAEEVEKVNPDLVARDDKGQIYTVRYEAVNAMLLNEFLKEHRTVQELKKEIAALTATVQKVSAQVEMSRPAPQTVVNNH